MQTMNLSYSLFPLLSVMNQKPVDVGCGRLSASIGSDGLIRSINYYHPSQGFVTLAPIGQFPNDKWYDSAFVRQYRRRLISDQVDGFGFRWKGNLQKQKVYQAEKKFPFFYDRFGEIDVSSLFLAVEEKEKAFLIQRIEVKNGGDQTVRVPFEVGGTFSLNRCSYGQLTEAGPIPIPPLSNVMKVQQNHLLIMNAHLPATVDVYLFEEGEPLILSPMEKRADEPITYRHEAELHLKKGESRTIHIVYIAHTQVEGQPELHYSYVEELEAKAFQHGPRWKKHNGQENITKFLIERNVNYIVSCCSIPVSDEHVCVITDHQLLPLSWNRDAYYMMQLLLESEKNVNELFEVSYEWEWRNKIRQILRGHLLWMFEKAERPDRYWGRAYLTNGLCKDKVFQLDQQCYPLLELCDYHERFCDKETVQRLLPQVKDILNMMMEYKDDQKWIFRTGETPADDKVDYPYHFSSQVLVWHTLQQLATLNETFAFYEADLFEWADRVKQDCLDAFVTSHKDRELFAYLTDLKGNYQLYHDANDLPTVYAPIWGFCDRKDERWIHTMEFAFSPENKGGFYTGEFGGLGSVHTPHAWPLGDGQELLFSGLVEDSTRQDQVLCKLKQVVQWDGLFSEAIHEERGTVESRHWFSWPGAFISCVLLYLKEE
ncbi:hypothetical protein DNHGIG_34910 [Collibacillus ludicampi]|uniref:Uncharacterized protein n=1 Tax=Collibacillus ludicampi TaxID=2771369 RepID=A0AAV4LJ88_9BACL|nr:glycoside hydrolase family 125 protein [Collibacillus ludicampi]GIM47942.1 hypothetical protein DNHGIG_34910 [Collibacillus ludicampi]